MPELRSNQTFMGATTDLSQQSIVNASEAHLSDRHNRLRGRSGVAPWPKDRLENDKTTPDSPADPPTQAQWALKHAEEPAYNP